MSLEIRKIVKYWEETRIEIGRPVEPPLEMLAVAAVIKNPWAGRGYVEDLRPEILAVAPALATLLTRILVDLAGSADRVQAFGKAAVVGINGEIEQASAVIHTLRFGNVFREGVGGTSFLPSTNKRGAVGCVVTLPLKHKLDEGLRSHFLTLEFTVSDAPGPDEILVAIGAATRGRAFPRIGNRYLDKEELAAEGG
jgi:hypothetical protein